MKRFLLLVTCFCIVKTLFSQNAPNLGNNVGGSADVTAVSKAGNVPVDYFSGIPAITIPLFSYSRSGIDAPVSLDYQAGGIRVDEDATNVGLGWHVSAGGVVTRMLRGLPDDCPGRGFMYTPKVEFKVPGIRPPINGGAWPQGGFEIPAYLNDSIDSQCDVFQFHFPGASGQFVIGKDGKIVILPESNIKITYDTAVSSVAGLSMIRSFTITATNGAVYVFSEPEITSGSLRGYYNTSGYTSAWYLKQIIAPFGIDTVSFNYNTTVTRTLVNLPSSKMEDGSSDPIIFNSSQWVSVIHKVISEIVYPYNLRVKFNYYGYQRCDIKGEFALKNIEVRDTLLHNGWRFQHKYFTEIAGKEFAMDSLSCSGEVSKLKLQGLIPYNQFGDLPGYEFGYMNLGVPKRGNKGKDHWGFFNNKNNTDLYPPAGNLPGADRNPDPLYAQAGTLISVKYPNGNRMVMDFELNDASTYYYSDNVKVSTGPLNGTSANIVLSNYSGKSFTFVISEGNRGRCRLIYTLKNASGITVAQFDASTSSNYQISLPNGNYTLGWTKDPAAVCDDSYYDNYAISWINEIINNGYQQVGGLRVKQIADYDTDLQKPPLIRRFSYKKTDGTSSGFILSKPVYDYQYDLRRSVPNGVSHHYYTTRISEPINNLNFINGGVVGYAYVNEVTPGMGKIAHSFSSYLDHGYFPPRFVLPFADIFMPTWVAGLPIGQATYDEGGKILARTTNTYLTTFQPMVDTLFKSVKLSISGRHIISAGASYDICAQEEYYPVNGKVQSTGKSEVKFAGADSTQSTATFTYDAKNNLKTTRIALNKQKTKFLETRLYYPYDYTVAGALQQMKQQGLILPVATEKWLITTAGEFMTDMVLYEYQDVGNGIIALKNTYKLMTDKPVPLAVVGAFNPAVLNRYPSKVILTETINKFDAKSVSLETTNILDQSKEAIIWDEAQQTSLASVLNAGYDEIAYTSFESGNNGRWSLPAGSYVYNTSITGRKAFRFTGNITTSVVQGKKYTVTYWTTGQGTTVNGTAGTLLKSRRGWNLYEHALGEGTSTITVVGSAMSIDELRAYPINARMMSQTPEPFLGVISKCDGLNNVRYFVYDDLGRERLRKDEYGNIISMSCYGRANQQVDCNAVYRNYETRFGFVQQGCSSGAPDTIFYIIPAGKYISSVSQYTVDSLAMDEGSRNGQAYANAQGTCGKIYVKLVYEAVTANSTMAKAYFYADAACTRPRVVNNLKVNYSKRNTCEGDEYDFAMATGSSCYLTSLPYFSYYAWVCDELGNNCHSVECFLDVYLEPGAYIIK